MKQAVGSLILARAPMIDDRVRVVVFVLFLLLGEIAGFHLTLTSNLPKLKC
jgi:hypothetical protein